MTHRLYWLRQPAFARPLLLFVAVRLLLTGWMALMVAMLPPPAAADEAIRPYLGEPPLREGAAGLLLGPWQRFDTQHYLRIARDGYASAADSVFPPLYPLLVRAGGALLGGGAAARLAAALLIANAAALGLLLLLYRVVTAELGEAHAARTLLYLALFPTGFFLFAAYTESLFLLLALGSFWAGRRGRFWLAGALGFLAAATRLTGWVLAIPLAYEWLRRHRPAMAALWAGSARPTRLRALAAYAARRALPAAALPGVALLAFLALRHALGLPPLGEVYAAHWFQTTGVPGQDIFAALGSLLGAGTARAGGAPRAGEPIQLSLDLFCVALLLVTTVAAFRRLGPAYGLYAAMLLLFILLPTSEVKPLYSASRYTLAFFPTFMLLGRWGERPWINRLILYPSVALFLFFSGQFAIWGWVA